MYLFAIYDPKVVTQYLKLVQDLYPVLTDPLILMKIHTVSVAVKMCPYMKISKCDLVRLTTARLFLPRVITWGEWCSCDIHCVRLK